MDNMGGGVPLGRLLLALDRMVVSLVDAPRGLDVTVSSVALLDPDDLHLGLGTAARSAEMFMLVGATDAEVVGWLGSLGGQVPVAVMVKTPSSEVVAQAAAVGSAVVAVDHGARWERLYNLVGRVIGQSGPVAGEGDVAESMSTGTSGDMFALAQAVAARTGGLVSIEDARSHVLAYSAAGDEADELRRLSILGREGPPAMLAWLRQWGVMDALRNGVDVVSVEARDDLGLRARLAVGIRRPGAGARGRDEYLGTIWLQRATSDFSADAGEVIAGAASVAARIIGRAASVPSAHTDQVRRLLGLRGSVVDVSYLAEALNLSRQGPVTVVGFAAGDPAHGATPALAGYLPALTLHASAFRPESVTTTVGGRAYVVLPRTEAEPAVRWARSAVDAAARQFGARVRAVIGDSAIGLAAVPDVRVAVDRVLDAAQHTADLTDDVVTVEMSRTSVLLGEIVAHLGANPDLQDPRVQALRDHDAERGTELIASVRAYLDAFGDVRSAAQSLHVHPNTLRYRIRRAQVTSGIDLTDPATRLVVALALRV